MVIRLTASCNNRCFFCMVDQEIAEGDHRPFAEHAALIDATPAAEEIDIFGGEPTIDPVFWEVVEHALRSGRRVTLASNVRLFSHRPSAERLAALSGGRLEVRTSLMGPTPALHDRLNGVARGAFIQTVEGIRNLTDAGFDVQTNIVILAENLDHLLSTALVALEAGSRRIKLSGTIRTGAFLDSVPDPAAVRERLRRAIPLLTALGASISLEKLSPCLAPGHLALISRESDPEAESRTWYRRVDACHRCSLVTSCAGAEAGALARFGEGWVEPIADVPVQLVDEIGFDEMDDYQPRKDRPFVKVRFDADDLEQITVAIPALARFASRYPQVHVIA